MNAESASPHAPDPLRNSRGVTLLEVAIGAMLMAFLAAGTTRMNRTQIKSNSMTMELADESNVLRAFVDVLRTIEASSGFFVPGTPREMDFKGYRVSLIFYDHTSSGSYRQHRGLVLACVKLDFTKGGVRHKLETTTLLRPR